MAQRLLDSLQKVPKDQLPTGAECMICKEEYGTVPSDNGTVEHAVWLPCFHHVGSECIAIWLSPGDGLGNSCPLCRTVFFEKFLRDFDDSDSDEDDDDDEGDGHGDSGDSDGDDDGEEDEEGGGSDEGDEDGSDGGSVDEDAEREDDEFEGRGRQSQMTFAAYYRSSFANTRSQHPQIDSQEDQTCLPRWTLLPSPTQHIEDCYNRARSQLLRSSSSPPPPPPSSAFLLRRSTSAQMSTPSPVITKVLKFKNKEFTFSWRAFWGKGVGGRM